ncbi:MAG: DUF1838 family protein [Rhodospirillaceae bacterium]|nr:DUF1838 family protein [Rhodospirillaceae bacterium]MBT5240991.1 DUF1838 family protein [Rhodospirillaceae bacterium]MBT6090942.1 DUF1838 family protein [Rhodospirillaceae bacterium]
MITGPLTTLTRRAALAGATASLGVSAASHSVRAQNGFDKNKLYVQLRGNLDGTDGLWSYSGAYWGKPQGEIARQLFRVDGFSFNTMTLREDGGVDQKMIECGFWQHPDTDELADTWTNPMNGLVCEPKHFKSSQTLSFDAEGNWEATDRQRAAMRYFEGVIVEPIVNGPVIWSQERLITKAIRPEPEPGTDPLTFSGPVRTGTSLATYTANIDDLDEGFVPTTMHYQSMGGWYPWMRMGQRAGVCSFELVGRKLPSTDEIPERVVAFLNDRRPGFITDPWA